MLAAKAHHGRSARSTPRTRPLRRRVRPSSEEVVGDGSLESEGVATAGPGRAYGKHLPDTSHSGLPTHGTCCPAEARRQGSGPRTRPPAVLPVHSPRAPLRHPGREVDLEGSHQAVDRIGARLRVDDVDHLRAGRIRAGADDTVTGILITSLESVRRARTARLFGSSFFENRLDGPSLGWA